MPVIQFIPQTYCRTCHLSTRMDIPRCLHCNQLLQPPQVKAVRKPAAKLRVVTRQVVSRQVVSRRAASRYSAKVATRKAKARHR